MHEIFMLDFFSPILILHRNNNFFFAKLIQLQFNKFPSVRCIQLNLRISISVLHFSLSLNYTFFTHWKKTPPLQLIVSVKLKVINNSVSVDEHDFHVISGWKDALTRWVVTQLCDLICDVSIELWPSFSGDVFIRIFKLNFHFNWEESWKGKNQRNFHLFRYGFHWNQYSK